MADVFAPVEIAKTGDDITPPAFAIDADPRAYGFVDQGVFGVGVEEAILIEADRNQVIDFLMIEMGGIIIEAEVGVWNGLKEGFKGIKALEVGFKPVFKGRY